MYKGLEPEVYFVIIRNVYIHQRKILNHQYYDEKSMKLQKKQKNKIVVRPRTHATTYRPERQEVGTAIKEV